MDDAVRTDQIEEVVMPVLRDHGLELVDVEWRPLRPRGVLRLFVDKPGGASIEDCARLSRETGDLLEVSGLIAESYDLEVSSPGLDRLLRSDREFRWACGKRVRCWFREPLQGRTEVRGRLLDVAADRLTIQTEGDRVEVPREVLSKARLDAEVPWPRHA